MDAHDEVIDGKTFKSHSSNYTIVYVLCDVSFQALMRR